MLELLRLFDAMVLGLALLLTTQLLGVGYTGTLGAAAILAMGIYSLIAAGFNVYRTWRGRSVGSEILQQMLAWIVTFIPVTAAIYSLGQQEVPVYLVAVWFLFGAAYIVLSRVGYRLVLPMLRKNNRNVSTAAIVGATRFGNDLKHEIETSPWIGVQLLGVFDDRVEPPGRIDGPTEGTTKDLLNMARAGQIDIVYVALPLRAEVRISQLIMALGDTTTVVQFVVDLSDFGALHSRFDLVGTIPTISIVDTPFRGRTELGKRVFDIALTLLCLITLAPLLAVVAIAIKLTSPGPVLFRQQRYGIDGKRFWLWKFRSMTVTESGDAFTQVTRADPRITPVGRFLRRFSLDELPQLINVLEGNMSLVGPRPHAIQMNEDERQLINRYMQRHIVKPGITGLAQVNGYRGETDTREKIEGRIHFDLVYIETWTPALDLRILWRTALMVLNDPNAY